VLLRAGAGGGADAFVGIRTNNVNRLIIGDTGVSFPSAAPVTFTGNPTVNGGTAQWSLDLLDIDTSITLDAAAHIDIADASTWMATTGDIRCGRTFSLTARNGANSADHALIDYTSNYLTIGSYDAADRVYYLMLRGHTYAQLSAAGKNVTLGSSGLTSTGDWLFASSMAAPKIYQETDSTADVEADDLTVYAQGVSAAGGTHAHAGNLGLRGGIASGNAANTDGNVWFHASPGALANWQGMENGMFIADRVAAPSGNPANGGFFYSEGGALYWRGSSGTVTCIAPA
jgi:hypothetical protein